jgi:hypothetical protein
MGVNLMSDASFFKKYKMCVLFFLLGTLIGGISVFYVQKSAYKKRSTLAVLDATVLLIPPLFALQQGDTHGANKVLRSIFNKAIIILVNADKNYLKENSSKLQFINDSRMRLNCNSGDEHSEQNIQEFFKSFQHPENTQTNSNRKIKVLRTFYTPPQKTNK